MKEVKKKAYLRRILGNFVLLAGLSAFSAGCASSYECDCIGNQPYNFAKTQLTKKEKFTKTLSIYRLEQTDHIIFVYPYQTGFEVFKTNQNSLTRDMIGIGYYEGRTNDMDPESISVYMGKHVIIYEKDEGEWTKICAKRKQSFRKDKQLRIDEITSMTRPKQRPFFRTPKRSVSNEEVQKYLDLINELKTIYPQ